MTAYYSEIDPFAAAWLRELIKAGHIAPGEVDMRSIADVMPSDLAGFTQCHFFAGIGVWSYALRQAGWTDDRPVWTGSCPCQPFSSAGKGKGFKDERHLWPEFYRLISQCRPPVCFGEQVASKDGLAWVELVQANMESSDYAFGAVDTCAAGVGAPHIRQRLYWVGVDTLGNAALRGCVRREMGNKAGTKYPALGSRENEGCGRHDTANDGACLRLADTNDKRPQGRCGVCQCTSKRTARESCVVDGLAHAECEGLERPTGQSVQRGGLRFTSDSKDCERPGPTNGFWGDADWLFCRDGKWRPTQSIVVEMADGLADRLGYSRFGDRWSLNPLIEKAENRVGRLKGYGNAINAEQAKAFIEAFMELH